MLKKDRFLNRDISEDIFILNKLKIIIIQYITLLI